MSSKRGLIITGGQEVCGLRDHLFDINFDLEIRRFEETDLIVKSLGGDVSGWSLVVLVPALSPLDSTLLALESRLAELFSITKSTAAVFEDSGNAPRFVVLLRGAAAMGQKDDLLNSALAGAMLSLGRTLSLELKKVGGSWNTIMYSSDLGVDNESDSIAPVAALISVLAGSSGSAINGQEIFAMQGADVGRLHP
ncbi:hypothetical protein [Martelella soudanensis]|uniref:hypothetical protein n=1 Tax=unclassified Martelella TaxID=2629616 RepID=UPI0015DDDF07|nr:MULTISPECIES: hypothetical protein [unclassified Martelella]